MTVLVENKAGGNFIPAGREVAGAPPDGHTLYFISTSSLITQALHPDYPLDIMKFTPVTEVATGPLILVARNGLGVKTPARTDRAAQQGAGQDQVRPRRRRRQLARRCHRAAEGAYRHQDHHRALSWRRPALNDLLGGHIDAMFDAMPVMAVQAKEGKVTPLAVTGAKRSFPCRTCRPSRSRAWIT